MRSDDVDAARHPIERHPGEHLVGRERVEEVAVGVAPRLELLGDPREQPGRRVLEADPQRLRLGRLLDQVAHRRLARVREPGHLLLLVVGGRRRALVGLDHAEVQVQADDAVRVEVGHVRGHAPRRRRRPGARSGRSPAGSISSANAAAVRRVFQPRSARRCRDQANPGTDGATTWKPSAAVGRVGEQRDGVEELVEGAGPAVDEHERQRIRDATSGRGRSGWAARRSR